MVKLVVLYTHPPDREAFDRHYEEVHAPLVRQVPDLRRVEVARITGGLRGESPYYLIAELYFDGVDAMNAAFASPEGRAMGKDARGFAGDLISMHVAEIQP